MSDFIDKSIKKLNIDRSEWELVNFGDVAIQQKKSVDRDTTGITKYVKGEHMNSEDLHLREWGELEDEYLGPAFIRLFDEGDILYGSRRTYLRKVTIAPFEGITSNTTFVIKPNEKRIDKRLLPFVMLSEGFAEHSIKKSKGSVNPYVNWKDIANYEFLLPPKEQQAELAELLWAMDDVIEKDLAVLEKLKAFLQIELNDLLFNVNNKTQQVHFKQLITDVFAGVSVKCSDEDYESEQKGILKTSAITGDKLILTEIKKVNDDDFGKLKKYLSKDTILINRKNTRALVGSSKYVEKDYPNIFLPDLIWELNVNKSLVHAKYFWYYLSSSKVRSEIAALSNGTNESMVNVSQTSLMSLKANIPHISDQETTLIKLDQISNSKDIVNDKIFASKALLKSLINEVF
jgi:type I restriction enzyme S subunit